MSETNQKKIIVKGEARMIAAVRGTVFTPYEKFEFELDPKVPLDTLSAEGVLKVINAKADTEFRLRAAKHFVEAMRKDIGLKRLVGGTRWCVDPRHMDVMFQ